MRLKGSSNTPSPNIRSRLLILDRFYFPDEQATSVYLTELTQVLREQFEFEILCGPPAVVTERNPSLSFSCRVSQVPCPKFSKRSLFTRALNDLSFLVLALCRGLFVKRPDLLVSQTSPPGIWWVGFLLSRWHRCRWIHVCKDVFPENLKVLNQGRNQFFISLLERVNSFLLKRADRIVVIGEDMKQRLLKINFSAGQIVRSCDWVDLNFIRPLPKKNSFSEENQLTNQFVVLYAGNFGRIHNFEDLLDAAERLRAHREIVFLLVGEGALKERIIRESQFRELTNVRVLPFEPRSRLPEVLAAADVSVVLLQEGMAGLSMPSKIYSILASGRPILACVDERSDIARMVREADSGFVIPPGHSEAFAQTVIDLFQDADLRNRLGTNARRFAEKEDFQNQAFQDYQRVFRQVLDGETIF